MDESLEDAVYRFLRDEYNRHMDEYIEKMVYGEGTGEPRGILSIALDAAAPARITKEAP